MKLSLSVFFLLIAFVNTIAAQNCLKREISILDVSARNGETGDGELSSAVHILKVAGLPFKVFTSIDSSLKRGCIILSSRLDGTTFNQTEKDSLISFVSNGGVLIAPNVRDSYMYPLFGISGNNTSTTNYKIHFNTFIPDPGFKWINDSLEKTISLGDSLQGNTIQTRSYNLSGALSLAKFGNNTSAITKHTYVSGKSYALGFSFKNLILNNQINRDYNANRSYSNGFEPTSDVIILFLKAVCADAIPYSTWLHTSMYDTKGTLILTHDVDATTAFDTMAYYADYESAQGLKSTYFITTHYINDGALSDFYNVFNLPKIQYLLNKGHKLASHSVGHYTDFDNETIFPLGTGGNNASNYIPYNPGNGNPTLNGTVMGETEVSKNLLEQNFGVSIRSFRAGYLAFNDKLINALDTLGYKFNSTFSANDVLTNFPYRNRKNRSAAMPQSTVWEIPMTISDVFNADPISQTNYSQKVNIWHDVINRNNENNAPTTLLIHPNRLFKLNAQQELINQLSSETFISDFESFADFWIRRDKISLRTAWLNDTLYLSISDTLLPLDPSISLVVNNGQDLSNIKVQDNQGNLISFISSNWNDNDLLLQFGSTPVSDRKIIKKIPSVSISPNPASDHLVIRSSGSDGIILAELYDTSGKLVLNRLLETPVSQISLDIHHLDSGIYLSKIITATSGNILKIIISR